MVPSFNEFANIDMLCFILCLDGMLKEGTRNEGWLGNYPEDWWLVNKIVPLVLY